jgi:hypothetical protein
MCDHVGGSSPWNGVSGHGNWRRLSIELSPHDGVFGCDSGEVGKWSGDEVTWRQEGEI